MATVSFNLAGGTGTNLSSYTFVSGGVTLVVKTTVAPDTPVSPQSFVNYTAPGLCVFARADAASRCNVAIGGTYNNLTFRLNRDAYLLSVAISQTVPTGAGVATFNAIVSRAGGQIGSTTWPSGNYSTSSPYRAAFASPIRVYSGENVVITGSCATANSSARFGDLVIETISGSVHRGFKRRLCIGI